MKSEDVLVISPKRSKGEDGYKTFSIRVREELVKNIDNISDKSGRSRNEIIALLLQYGVEHCKIEEKK